MTEAVISDTAGILGEKVFKWVFDLPALATSLILNGVIQLSLIAVSVTTMVSSKL